MFTKSEIIDNFLKPTHFDKLNNLKLKKIDNHELNIYSNKIYKNGKIECTCLEDDFIKELFQNYHEKCFALLQKLNKDKATLWDYSEFHIIETGANYKYPIHRDSPFKILSGVIYISPEINKGTLIYADRYGKDEKEIEWKQNRGFFFSRNEHNSYHSYRGNGTSHRRALVLNLMTNNLKEVCKIENVNFLKIKLREFINPYLYRIFKKVI